MNDFFSIGPCNKILLLGGGRLLRDLCVWSESNNHHVSVITSSRHAVEVINNETLESFLNKNNIPYLISDDIDNKEVEYFISDTQETFCLSLGAAWIFKTNVIEKYFQNRLFNLHGTRLPQNRGGGGFSWQVMTANRFGFCVLHLVDGGVDSGDIILFDEFLYPAACRIPIDYENLYVEKNFVFLTNLLNHITLKEKHVKPIAQSEYFSTHWPRLHTLTNSWIDWSMEVNDLERFICAFDDPYSGAQTYINGKNVHLKRVSLNFQDGVFHSYQSGLVYRKTKSWICVCVKGAALIIESVIDENDINMLDLIKVGDRFLTPIEELEGGKKRVIYGPSGLK
jgi:methionyl-tRNA formyltransferase